MTPSKEPLIKFVAGDRVKEKNKLKTLFVKESAPKEYEDRIKKNYGKRQSWYCRIPLHHKK